MDRKTFLLGACFAFCFVIFDFFSRVLLSDVSVKSKNNGEVAISTFERKKTDVESFIKLNFVQLLAQENKIKAQNKAKEQNNKPVNNNLAKSKPKIIRMAKLMGIISLNGDKQAVIEYKNSLGKITILTLQKNQMFADGKVSHIGDDYVEVDVQGKREKLPLFKNKNIKFQG
ncbi:MAG: hypothetical protein ACPG46_01660 [Thalassotalea sp.]